MSEQTPNHGLSKFSIGETDWTHSPDMQILEETVPIRDTEANMGNYTPHSGAKFKATDTEREFIGDGNAWNRLASTGQDPEFDSVVTEELYNIPRQPNQWADGSRPVETTEDTTLYVDGTNGSDDAEGTETDPIATLQEAAFRTPYIHNHDFKIVITAAGTYTSARFPPILAVAKPNSSRSFSITSADGLATADVELDGTIGVSVIDGELDEPTIEGVTITGTIVQKVGNIRVENCTLTCAGNPLTLNGSDPVAYSAHADTTVVFANCDFSGSVAYAVGIEEDATAILRNCSGRVDRYVGRVRRGATLKEDLAGELWGTLGWIEQANAGSWIDQDGEHRGGGSAVLYDDWGDGRLTDRLRPALGTYRPEWASNSGSPTAVDGAAVLPAGDATTQNIRTRYMRHRMTTGTWEFTLQKQATTSTGSFDIRLISGSGYWAFRVENGGTVQLLEAIDGASFDLISGSWPDDTDEHTFKVTRDEAGQWEVFVDDTSQGTHTDLTTPQPERVWFINRLDADVHVSEFSMRK